jgi:oligo-1,6-glucosidase
MSRSSLEREWWKEAVVYQIYPRSFNDSDGDGVGDIPGIVEKLDYLDDLGIDVVWLNPVYESPNADNGYDIADYRAVMDEFGTMADWERLLDELHARDIRLIMDLVVNHTSDEHEWFVRSRREPAGEYGDYYVWREGRPAADADYDVAEGPEDEVPPNNWESFFGGPAWGYDDEREEWYLHLFDRKQPDLDWENPAVREDVFEMMEWWLEKGIDGFRMDVINLLSKPRGLPDVDTDAGFTVAEQVANGRLIHEYLGEMNDRVLADRDVMTVGEMLGAELPLSEARRYLDEDLDGLSMLFHFEHMLLDKGENIWEREDWDLTDLKEVFSRWQARLYRQGWNSLYLNNHDQPRMVSRFGDDGAYRVESATLLATLLHTLRGTPYVYQGEEIGMTNYPFERLEEFRDVDTLLPIENAIDAGDIDSFDEVKEAVRANSRDNARTPMQWTDGEHAGFTDGEPWIPVNPNHTEINVEAARENEDSVWQYYRRLIELREQYDVMVYGEYDLLLPDHERLWVYTRTLDDTRWLVLLNFADATTAVPLETTAVDTEAEAELVIGNYDDAATDLTSLTMRPWEARVLQVE